MMYKLLYRFFYEYAIQKSDCPEPVLLRDPHCVFFKRNEIGGHGELPVQP